MLSSLTSINNSENIFIHLNILGNLLSCSMLKRTSKFSFEEIFRCASQLRQFTVLLLCTLFIIIKIDIKLRLELLQEFFFKEEKCSDLREKKRGVPIKRIEKNDLSVFLINLQQIILTNQKHFLHALTNLTKHKLLSPKKNKIIKQILNIILNYLAPSINLKYKIFFLKITISVEF